MNPPINVTTPTREDEPQPSPTSSVVSGRGGLPAGRHDPDLLDDVLGERELGVASIGVAA